MTCIAIQVNGFCTVATVTLIAVQVTSFYIDATLACMSVYVTGICMVARLTCVAVSVTDVSVSKSRQLLHGRNIAYKNIQKTFVPSTIC